MLKSYSYSHFVKDRTLPPTRPKSFQSNNPFANAQRSFQRVLKGFDGTINDNSIEWICTRPARDDFPVPELLLILLRDVMDFPMWGPEDKSRWAVYARVDGEPIRLELAKAGLRIWHGKDSSVDLHRVIGQLRAALGRLEKLLAPLLAQAVDDGNATIANLSYEFRDRYTFFRAQAELPFQYRVTDQVNAEPEDTTPRGMFTKVFESAFADRQHKTIAFYNSIAMIDAYFSYIENRTTLLRAFTGQPLEKGGLERFLRAKWDAKLRGIAPDSHSQEFKNLLGRLRAVKEKFRNPFAHGGTENDRGSIFCHVPSVGTIPGNMSGFKGSARFQFMPLDTEDHVSICQLFDELDAYLHAGQLEVPSRLADGGVNPAWDAASLVKYAALNTVAITEVEQYIKYWNHEQDRHDNMDY
jgi:hypothetical protein